jgi:HEPN domain-containing protein
MVRKEQKNRKHSQKSPSEQAPKEKSSQKDKKPILTRASVDLWLKDLDYTKNKAIEFVKLGHFDTAALYIHMAVEKSLKAAIVAFKQKEPPKTHNLKRLYSEISDQVKLTDEQIAFLDELTPVISKTRYMDVTLELADEIYTEDITSEYLKKAVPIIEMIKRRIEEKRS